MRVLLYCFVLDGTTRTDCVPRGRCVVCCVLCDVYRAGVVRDTEKKKQRTGVCCASLVFFPLPLSRATLFSFLEAGELGRSAGGAFAISLSTSRTVAMDTWRGTCTQTHTHTQTWAAWFVCGDSTPCLFSHVFFFSKTPVCSEVRLTLP